MPSAWRPHEQPPPTEEHTEQDDYIPVEFPDQVHVMLPHEIQICQDIDTQCSCLTELWHVWQTLCEEEWYVGACNRSDAEHALHLVNKVSLLVDHATEWVSFACRNEQIFFDTESSYTHCIDFT